MVIANDILAIEAEAGLDVERLKKAQASEVGYHAIDPEVYNAEVDKVALAVQLCLAIHPEPYPGIACADKTGHDGVHSWAQGSSLLVDVKRLARAMLTRDFSTLHHCFDCFSVEAEAIAAEYDRLSRSESDDDR